MRALAVVLALTLGVDVVPGPPRRRASPSAASSAALQAQVRAREAAFAKTMADRDLTAFASFVSEEAVFVGGSVMRGRRAVTEGWRRLFEAKTAPFSWAPELVEVTDSGTLALSRGPVFAPNGTRTGTFTSTWRLEGDGVWRIVLDSGCPPCHCDAAAPPAKDRD